MKATATPQQSLKAGQVPPRPVSPVVVVVRRQEEESDGKRTWMVGRTEVVPPQPSTSQVLTIEQLTTQPSMEGVPDVSPQVATQSIKVEPLNPPDMAAKGKRRSRRTAGSSGRAAKVRRTSPPAPSTALVDDSNDDSYIDDVFGREVLAALAVDDEDIGE